MAHLYRWMRQRVIKSSLYNPIHFLRSQAPLSPPRRWNNDRKEDSVGGWRPQQPAFSFLPQAVAANSSSSNAELDAGASMLPQGLDRPMERLSMTSSDDNNGGMVPLSNAGCLKRLEPENFAMVSGSLPTPPSFGPRRLPSTSSLMER